MMTLPLRTIQFPKCHAQIPRERLKLDVVGIQGHIIFITNDPFRQWVNLIVFTLFWHIVFLSSLDDDDEMFAD